MTELASKTGLELRLGVHLWISNFWHWLFPGTPLCIATYESEADSRSQYESAKTTSQNEALMRALMINRQSIRVSMRISIFVMHSIIRLKDKNLKTGTVLPCDPKNPLCGKTAGVLALQVQLTLCTY